MLRSRHGKFLWLDRTLQRRTWLWDYPSQNYSQFRGFRAPDVTWYGGGGGASEHLVCCNVIVVASCFLAIFLKMELGALLRNPKGDMEGKKILCFLSKRLREHFFFFSFHARWCTSESSSVLDENNHGAYSPVGEDNCILIWNWLVIQTHIFCSWP